MFYLLNVSNALKCLRQILVPNFHRNKQIINRMCFRGNVRFVSDDFREDFLPRKISQAFQYLLIDC